MRIIRLQYKRNELAELTRNNNINILGIVDQKICHEEKIRYEKHNKLTLLTTSAWRNTINVPTGGVGILVNSKSENALSKQKLVTKWSPKTTKYVNSEYQHKKHIIHTPN